MPSYSISDIGRSIVGKSDPYNREMGAFSAFMSPERKSAFHRINVEHLHSISNSRLGNIENILYDGFRYNIQAAQGMQIDIGFIKNDVNSIKQYSKAIYSGVIKMSDGLDKTNETLNKILDVLSNPSSSASIEKSNLARKNMAQAKKLEPSKATILLDEANDLLSEAIKKSPLNYGAYFDKGWLESFYYQDYNKAINSFDNAVIRSIDNDNDFCSKALRYLADTYSLVGAYDKAIESIEKAIELNRGDLSQINLEYTQYLIKNDESEKAIKIMDKLIKREASNFTYFSTDPIILSNKKLHNHLLKLYNECKENIVFSARSIYQPKEKHELVIKAKVRSRLMIKDLNIPLSNEAKKTKEVNFGLEDENIFNKLFLKDLKTQMEKIDYLQLRGDYENENRNMEFLKKSFEKSAKFVFSEMGYKDALIESVALKKRKGFFGKF